jgi:predicted ATP-grasp superfamily ATP-dependent carboligase
VNPVIVLGCDSNGYGVIRSIAKFDGSIPIIGTDYNTNSPGLFSKYLTDIKIISNPNNDSKNTVKDLINLGEQFKEKPVVIITSDIFLTLFNDHREKLAKYFLFNIPAKELLNTILDKGKQYEAIKSLGVDVPRTIFLPQHEKINHPFDLKFPVFIKGAFPHIWKQYFTEKGFIANDEFQLISKIREIHVHNLDLVIQELIVGPNSNHYKVSSYYDKNGEPKLFFTTQKARQFPYDFGVGSHMKSKRVEELLESGRRIFDALHYTGIGSMEFKKDERDGEFKFIELNPRMWQQNYQATIAGLNFAEYYYKDCIGEKIEFNDQFLENITYMDSVNDFQSFMLNKKVTDESYFEWIKQVITSDSFAFYEEKDIKPILHSSNYGLNSFRYLYKSLRALKNV